MRYLRVEEKAAGHDDEQRSRRRRGRRIQVDGRTSEIYLFGYFDRCHV
jgi:hypothetical protein